MAGRGDIGRQHNAWSAGHDVVGWVAAEWCRCWTRWLREREKEEEEEEEGAGGGVGRRWWWRRWTSNDGGGGGLLLRVEVRECEPVRREWSLSLRMEWGSSILIRVLKDIYIGGGIFVTSPLNRYFKGAHGAGISTHAPAPFNKRVPAPILAPNDYWLMPIIALRDVASPLLEKNEVNWPISRYINDTNEWDLNHLNHLLPDTDLRKIRETLTPASEDGDDTFSWAPKPRRKIYN
ncbi:hypothetical protein PIB30_024495 [Stylosanthes scabra]|uniref:Uncharacterized protein n=1 Tax=Stylosanthes scabra TaxID=79078 RepID=A0ABU6Z7D8_9FABA|nr:hypothetical protein [Stylosanthes scabra]